MTASVSAATRSAAPKKPLDLGAIYRDLHQNPELSNQEVRTSKILADTLQNLGFDVTRNFGGTTGVVGLLKNGEGPVVMVRTDMDALPVKEATGLPYASTKTAMFRGNKTPVMHACGHDMHMSVFLGVAEKMAQNKKDWHGTLMMVGQPAEELGTGARDLIKAGLFEKIAKPDYILGNHVSADLPAGTVATMEGPFSSNTEAVNIKVKGIGGHGAFPHTTKDPVVLASKIVLALQTIVSREVPPEEPAVITVGKINGGSKNNVIPEEVDLSLSVRSYSEKVRKQLREAIERVAKNEARASGLPEDKLPSVEWFPVWVPAIQNDHTLAQKFDARAKVVLGDKNVEKRRFGMAAEDFANYGYKRNDVKSLMFLLGAVKPLTHAAAIKAEKALPSLHSDQFKPDPTITLNTGVKVMSDFAQSLMQK